MASDITRTRPPGTTDDHREQPRRPMAAGHVMIVCLVALAVGFLLNAPGILKTAKGQPLGWKRDIAVAVATTRSTSRRRARPRCHRQFPPRCPSARASAQRTSFGSGREAIRSAISRALH